MSDPKDEQTRRAREDAPDTRLAERLLARATQSLGVIDVRHAERQYARVMDWLAGRTSLVEHLRSRYGLTTDVRAAGLGLTFADAHGQAGEQGSDEAGSSISTAPGVPETPAAERLFTYVAHVPEDFPAAPAETRRIRRRGGPTFSPLSQETRPGAGGVQAGARQEAVGGGNDTLELSGAGSDQMRSLRAPFSVTEMPDESAPATHRHPTTTATEETTTPGTRTGKPLARSAELSTGMGETASARTGGAEGGRRAANANELGETALTEAAKPDVLRVAESADANPPLPEPLLRARPQVTDLGDVESAKARGLKAETAPTLVTGELEATNVSGETRLPLAQAREVLTGGSAHEKRFSLAQSALPLAASPSDGERAHTTPTRHAPANVVEPAAGRASTGVDETPAAGRGRGKTPGVNVERLAEQVSRHLTRRLLVERERRGLGRK